MLCAIACIDNNWGIGYKNNLLIHLKKDMKRFKDRTIDAGTVIMGYNTYVSLKKPLSDRRNIVITHKSLGEIEPDKELSEGTSLEVSTIDKVKDEFYNFDCDNYAYVIGGASLYNEMIPDCAFLELTHVDYSFKDEDAFIDSNLINKFSECYTSKDTDNYKDQSVNVEYKIYRNNDWYQKYIMNIVRNI